MSCLGFLEAELSRWHDNHNSVYVSVVEEHLTQAFTSYRHTKEDEYVRRNLNRWVCLGVVVGWGVGVACQVDVGWDVCVCSFEMSFPPLPPFLTPPWSAMLSECQP